MPPPAASLNGAAANPDVKPQVRQFAINGQVTPALGKIIAVLMSSPRHRALTLEAILNHMMPCVAANQFLVADAKMGEGDATAPVGLVLWASVSGDVDRRLSADPSRPLILAPKEWRSGDIPWVIEAVGPPKLIEAMLKQLVEGPLKGKPIKFRRKGESGQPVIQSWPPQA
jgi:cytolysin-activating lysine-acyltransferase